MTAAATRCPDQVAFYWDVASPYAFLAVAQLDRLCRSTAVEILFKPFFLGGVFRANGHQAPSQGSAKAAYLNDDLRRWRDFYGIAMRIPVEEVPFPINSVVPQRVALLAGRAGLGERYCREVFAAYWGEGRDVSQLDVLATVIAKVGLDPAPTLREAQAPEVKEALRQETADAVGLGIFGAPTFVFAGDLYWGHDRMDLLAHALQKQAAERRACAASG